jgi:hypothetical protein
VTNSRTRRDRDGRYGDRVIDGSSSARHDALGVASLPGREEITYQRVVAVGGVEAICADVSATARVAPAFFRRHFDRGPGSGP